MDVLAKVELVVNRLIQLSCVWAIALTLYVNYFAWKNDIFSIQLISWALTAVAVYGWLIWAVECRIRELKEGA